MAGLGELRQADLARGLEPVGGKEVKRCLQLALLNVVRRLPEMLLLSPDCGAWASSRSGTPRRGGPARLGGRGN
jgi:hypothetical protein